MGSHLNRSPVWTHGCWELTRGISHTGAQGGKDSKSSRLPSVYCTPGVNRLELVSLEQLDAKEYAKGMTRPAPSTYINTRVQYMSVLCLASVQCPPRRRECTL